MPVARAALLTVLSMAAVTVAPAVARRVIREAAVRVPGDILARAAMAAGQLAAAARVPGVPMEEITGLMVPHNPVAEPASAVRAAAPHLRAAADQEEAMDRQMLRLEGQPIPAVFMVVVAAVRATTAKALPDAMAAAVQ